MDTTRLPHDFKEFLRLLNSESVEYMIVGSYAVGYHGYPRATNDLDIWVRVSSANAERIVRALRAFGFKMPGLKVELFLAPDKITRMGLPPFRIEILTGISGVTFDDCFPSRVNTVMDGVEVAMIGLKHLKRNKLAAGRLKDLADLENLP